MSNIPIQIPDNPGIEQVIDLISQHFDDIDQHISNSEKLGTLVGDPPRFTYTINPLCLTLVDTLHEIPHNLGYLPRFVDIRLVCKTYDIGFNSGYSIPIYSYFDPADGSGLYISVTDTHLKVRVKLGNSIGLTMWTISQTNISKIDPRIWTLKISIG